MVATNCLFLQENNENMKKILLVIGMMLLLLSCNSGYKSNRSYSEDSVEIDTMKAPKVTKETIKVRRRLFPDSIRVAFTRNGKFVDSVTAYNLIGIYEGDEDYIEPEYCFEDAVGHKWFYDIHGKFKEFVESPYPHGDSKKEEPYKP